MDAEVQWTVTDVQDGFGPAGMGVPNRIKHVVFKIVNGPESYVDVSLKDFADPVRLRALIDEHAQQTMAALSLNNYTSG